MSLPSPILPSTHINKPLPLTIETTKQTNRVNVALNRISSPIYQYPVPVTSSSYKSNPSRISQLGSAQSTSSSNKEASEVVSGLQKQITEVCKNTNALVERVKEGWEFLARILAIKQAFHAKKEDIAYFCTTHNLEGDRSPVSPKGAAVVEILDRSIYDLQAALFILDEQLKKANKSITPPTFRRNKLKKLVEETWKAWTTLMIHLTLAMSTSSSLLAETATSNVAKIAIATGNPDWEVLDEVNANALLASGDKYFLGYGVSKNFDTAFKRYTAASTHSAEACNMLGVLHENGYGCVKNITSAIEWYTKAGERGCGEGWNNLGRLYENGIGVEEDLRRTRDYYARAAESGCLDGMVNFGLMLENGIEGPVEVSKARVWYEKAADMNFARAYNCLGNLYYSGKGVKRDYGKAVEWFKRGADLGNPHAQNNLGICYESGLGVARDLAMAKWLYKSASENGQHPSATNNLGWMYLMEKSYMEAMKTFVLAMTQGSVDATYNLGNMYEHGCADADGVVCRCDLDIATRFWREAAQKGHTKAQLKLALNLLHPPSPFSHLRNPSEGFKYLEDAALSGSAEASYHLGNCYASGLGTEVDNKSARKWWSRASERGHAGAMFKLGVMLEEGLGLERDLRKAVALYAEADKLGSREARTRLLELKEVVQESL